MTVTNDEAPSGRSNANPTIGEIQDTTRESFEFCLSNFIRLHARCVMQCRASPAKRPCYVIALTAYNTNTTHAQCQNTQCAAHLAASLLGYGIQVAPRLLAPVLVSHKRCDARIVNRPFWRTGHRWLLLLGLLFGAKNLGCCRNELGD